MKKFCAVVFLLVVLAATDAFAGEITKGRLFGLGNYVPLFYDNNAVVLGPDRARIASSYYRVIESDTIREFRGLEGRETSIDTALEWALASYYSPAVVQIRPAEAVAILPENNRESPLKLASAVLHKMAEVKFLAPQDTAAVGRYEGMIKFIQDKHGLTRTEIDNYFRTALRAEVRRQVDQHFSCAEFNMNNDALRAMYITTLTVDPQSGLYTLSYYRPSVANSNKTIQNLTLNNLLAEMRKNTAEFDQRCIDTISDIALKIPSVFYANIKAREGIDALELVTEAIVSFYVNPSQDNYNTLAGINARMLINISGSNSVPSFALHAYDQVLRENLNELYSRINRQTTEGMGRNLPTLSRYPADPKYAVFGRSR
jgi:hypothetical protein